MVGNRALRRLVLVAIGVITSATFASGTAVAAELGDYRWERRPLLIFAPTDRDPRLAETQRQLDASRCDFDSRDMVLGVLVGEGRSTLDGQVVEPEQSRRLADEFGIGDDDFGVVLIGKDGGEKRRVGGVPNMRAIYDVVDGMPMRNRELNTDPGRC